MEDRKVASQESRKDEKQSASVMESKMPNNSRIRLQVNNNISDLIQGLYNNNNRNTYLSKESPEFKQLILEEDPKERLSNHLLLLY